VKIKINIMTSAIETIVIIVNVRIVNNEIKETKEITEIKEKIEADRIDTKIKEKIKKVKRKTLIFKKDEKFKELEK